MSVHIIGRKPVTGDELGFAKLEVPLSEGLAREVYAFWERIFGPGDTPIEFLLGSERHCNDASVYVARQEGRIAGTCFSVVSRALPALGGFGGVATEPALRRGGVATRLCRAAVEDFRAGGGQALFLGTGNPDAARVYHRLGWRKLAGSNVWANVTQDLSPEEFLVDYFRSIEQPIEAAPATPRLRVPMIPLIATPHDWHVLDANPGGMLSTRYRLQTSTMGQYPKYQAVAEDGRGAWFAAGTDDSRAVGLSSARLDEEGRCRVDAFTHRRFGVHWEALARAAMEWGEVRGASAFRARVSVEDEEKRGLFESLGFRAAGAGDDFELDSRAVGSLWLEVS